MSDLEKNAQEEATKKHPYNLREKKEKKAADRSLIPVSYTHLDVYKRQVVS